MLGQMMEQAAHQFINGGQRGFGFGGLLDEGGAIAGLVEIAVFIAKGRVGFAQADFAERVEFGTTAALETEVGFVEQIELAAKRRLRAARALGHRRHAAQVRREPLDNEARLRQRTGAQDEAAGGD